MTTNIMQGDLPEAMAKLESRLGKVLPFPNLSKRQIIAMSQTIEEAVLERQSACIAFK